MSTPLTPTLSPPAGRGGEFLVLEHLDKHFGGLHVTRDVSLSIRRSEILALLGPSGSGKTTVLRTVAGFEVPDSGRVLVDGEDVTLLPPERRNFGIVFQHYALFPHMTVGENVAFGLRVRRGSDPAGVRSAADIRDRVARALASVDLAGFEARKVTEISGGQQQRVALARALAPEPRVLLLDEPLSNLDPSLRGRTRRELKRIIRAAGITTLFVTHEQEEAFELGDRVALMHAGSLEQVGPARELYEAPASRFAAAFIGRSNVVPGTWESRGSDPAGVRSAAESRGRARLPGGAAWPAVAAGDLIDGSPVDVVVRPEALAFATARDGMAAQGSVVEIRFAGRETYFAVLLDTGVEVEVLAAPDAAEVGWKVFVAPATEGPAPRAYPRIAGDFE
ncbi:MAG TPA: ABC transporter ATP-binding protein [Thermoanaerobaculia bacterium]|nr:ABC transporter ATP-binding protein [Thermoanaerobaculia bacterium]